jgi:hypothetical protein
MGMVRLCGGLFVENTGKEDSCAGGRGDVGGGGLGCCWYWGWNVRVAQMSASGNTEVQELRVSIASYVLLLY